MKYVLAFFLTCTAVLFACKKEDNFVPVCDGSAPTYDADISAIITQNCVGCHSSYASYSGLSSDLSNGNFEREVLNEQTMPQGGSLSNAQLNQIKCWAENGFPEN
ncbi:MAG: hypothetical protein Crog4KO_16910 [Crocinitomicaceae bacterium]